MKNKIKQTVELKDFSSYKIGGKCSSFYHIKSVDEIVTAYREIKEDGSPFIIVGNGSNILFPDEELLTSVIYVGDLKGRFLSKEFLTLYSGEGLSEVIRYMAEEGFGGFQKLIGIPGTIGGAFCMNAGAFGVSFNDFVIGIKCLNRKGQIEERALTKGHYSYRQQVLVRKDEILVSLKLKLIKEDKEKIQNEIKEILEKRKEKQPLNFPSCGSVFKNPRIMVDGKLKYAWELIDGVGMRGFSIGGAEVSQKHPNFIINKKNAMSRDVKEIIIEIKKRVFEKYAINLEEEVVVL